MYRIVNFKHWHVQRPSDGFASPCVARGMAVVHLVGGRSLFDAVPELPVGFHAPQKRRRNALAQRLRRNREGKIWGRRRSACKHGVADKSCKRQAFTRGPLRVAVNKWRLYWETLTSAEQRQALLVHCQRSLPAVRAEVIGVDGVVRQRAGKVKLSFLGYPLCRRAFREITMINPWRAVKDAQAGIGSYKHPGFSRVHVRFEEMYSAIVHMVELLRNSSPFADSDPDSIPLPFHDKRILFKMIENDLWFRWHGPPWFVALPKYRTFLDVLGHADFKKVTFHRLVRIGRCPKCCLYQYKCRAATTPGERAAWQQVAAEHQSLQLAQKRQYAADRARAAADFPTSELYCGFDGGSGFEFWLPHLAAAAAEGPNKAADNVHTPALKVMNGLVHGDNRSHVMLSPWCVVAGSSHVCESIAVAVNTALTDHKRLPPRLTVQCDNASVNHSMCVLGFLALYVLLNVFDTARLRFLLENHAHDIYDAFQAVHKTPVERTTFYHLEELIQIIAASHKQSLRGEQSSSGSVRHGHAPAMGKDVLVTNMWEIRDIWEWLFPGRKARSAEATARGAIVYYEGIAPYHDFELRRKVNPTDPSDVSVELWAKRYMTDPTYAFIGTLTTMALFNHVVKGTSPKVMASENATEAKSEAANSALPKLEKLAASQYRQQFSPERMADAIAICKSDWGHFSGSMGAAPLESHKRMMPIELAKYMSDRQLLQDQLRAGTAVSSDEAAVAEASAWSESRARPPSIRQRRHELAMVHGIQRGPGIPVTAPIGRTQPKSAEEFCGRPAVAGAHVLSHAAANSSVGRSSAKMASLPFWVWKVLRVIEVGELLPENSTRKLRATCLTYEAQLMVPTKGSDLKSPLKAVWDKRKCWRAPYLWAPAEKDNTQPADDLVSGEMETVRVPMIGMLRAVNIVGGGFALTSSQRIPQVVAVYAVGEFGSLGSVGSAASVASTSADASSSRAARLVAADDAPLASLAVGPGRPRPTTVTDETPVSALAPPRRRL